MLEIEGVSQGKSFLQRKFYFDKIIRKFVEELLGYAISITHVRTGAWKSAHRSLISGDSARIYIDPSVTNPNTEQFVSVYASAFEREGGDMAVYERTIKENASAFDRFEEEIIAEVTPGY